MLANLSLVAWVGLLFVSIVVAVLAALMPAYDRREVRTRLENVSIYETGILSERDVATTGFHERAPVLFKKLAGFARRLSPQRAITYVNQQLVYAGLARELDKLLATKALTMGAGAGLAFVVAAIWRPAPWGLLLLAALPVTGFFLPDGWLSVKAKSRQKAMAIALPGVLDLLAVSVQAGLGFDAALSKVIKHLRGPLSEEFARMLKEMQMGMSRKDAFKSLRERTSVSELRSFLSAMIQSDVFGISVADTLRVQAREMRVKRAQKAEEIAQKAPVKLVFPTVFCIFPALFVVLLGPAVIRIYNAMLPVLRR